MRSWIGRIQASGPVIPVTLTMLQTWKRVRGRGFIKGRLGVEIYHLWPATFSTSTLWLVSRAIKVTINPTIMSPNFHIIWIRFFYGPDRPFPTLRDPRGNIIMSIKLEKANIPVKLASYILHFTGIYKRIRRFQLWKAANAELNRRQVWNWAKQRLLARNAFLS